MELVNKNAGNLINFDNKVFDLVINVRDRITHQFFIT